MRGTWLAADFREPIQAELRARRRALASAERRRLSLGRPARLVERRGHREVETREIAVQRTFSDFDDFWTTTLLSPSTGAVVATLPPAEVELLKARVVRACLATEGRITYSARANAVRGRVPG